MKKYLIQSISLLIVLLLFQNGIVLSQSDSSDPLPSWNDGAVKINIINFVADVTKVDGPLYVAPEDRIATFDNDGTLWCEVPTIQIAYTVERIKELYPSHPEWKDEKIFTAFMDGDKEFIEKDIESGGIGLMKVLTVTNSGMTLENFQQVVKEFFEKAKHPKFDVSFTKVYYVPMLELVNYLKANEFEVFICSGGGLDFMRVISEEIYGIPTQNVIGSFGKSKFEIVNGNSEIMKLQEILLINDKEGKPVGIDYFIGRKPIFSAGNVRSGGDIAMSAYCQSNPLPNIQLIVNHDDPVREFEYSEKNNESIAAAANNNWNLISMKNDWKKIFEFE